MEDVKSDTRRREAAANADTLAFEDFFEQEKDRLIRMLCVITGSTAEAEDIAQEAFTRVFERWASVSTMDEPTGYLHRAAMNMFRNHYRRAARSLRTVLHASPHPDVFDGVADREIAAQALAAMTPRQRAAVVLTEVLGYSGEETGAMLGIKASTVYALTHQAHAAARGVMEVPGV
jgi:RNA polymerase sigma-70 factor (ECF subfamily)